MKDKIYKILIKYKIKDSEAKKFIDGEGSEDVNILLMNFISSALKPFVKFPNDILLSLIKDQEKATEILLAMDTAIESVEEGLIGNSRSIIGDLITGKLNEE